MTEYREDVESFGTVLIWNHIHKLLLYDFTFLLLHCTTSLGINISEVRM